MIRQVLGYNDEDVAIIRKLYNVDENTIERDLGILQYWMKQQPHLPPLKDDLEERKFLEQTLMKNKFRVEKTKKKLDNYYTLRGLYRDYYQEQNQDIVPSKEKTLSLPLPLLAPDKSRVIIFRIDPNPETFTYKTFLKCLNLYLELMTRYDYAIGHTMLFDGSSFRLEHLKKLSIAETSKHMQLSLNAYSSRICGMEIVNPPPYVQVIMSMFKMALPKKIFEKFRIHDNLESLHERVPKRCLPCDLGGDLESIGEMLAKWDRVFEEHLDFFNRNYHNISDENLRVGDIKNQGFFGVDGTFKKLALD